MASGGDGIRNLARPRRAADLALAGDRPSAVHGGRGGGPHSADPSPRRSGSTSSRSRAAGWRRAFSPRWCARSSIAFLVIAMAKERLELRHKRAARIDPLTGLGNRRAFTSLARRRLRRERDEELRPQCSSSISINFKRVNDRFGHAIGDRVLQLFAAAAHQSLRPTDIVGRLGGEEFAALLSVADIGRRDRDRRESARRFRVRPPGPSTICWWRATVSVGVAVAQHGHEDLPKLLGRADEALYQAKARGRNRVEVASRSKATAVPLEKCREPNETGRPRAPRSYSG